MSGFAISCTEREVLCDGVRLLVSARFEVGAECSATVARQVAATARQVLRSLERRRQFQMRPLVLGVLRQGLALWLAQAASVLSEDLPEGEREAGQELLGLGVSLGQRLALADRWDVAGNA